MFKAVTFKQVMLCKWEQFRLKLLLFCFWKNAFGKMTDKYFFVEFPLKPVTPCET